MERQQHWEAVYRDKGEDETSWFRPRLDESLRLIDALDVPHGQPAIDVGGGRATLVDDLLAHGFRDVSVLDLSANALAEARRRLGAQGEAVHWIVGDIARIELPAAHYALWHDRAVFHFLVEPGEQARYVASATHAVRAGGHIVIGCFAPDGPERCSGLPVTRHAAADLVKLFAPAFDPVARSRELHRTPAGREQAFTYVVLRRRDDDVGL